MELKKMFDLEFLLECYKISEDRDKEREKISNFVIKTLQKLDKSKLTLVDLNGHQIHFFDLWNKFIKGSKLSKDEMTWIVTKWAYCLGRLTIFGLSKKKVTDKMFWDRVKDLGVEALNNECKITGDYLSVSLDNDFNFVFEKYEVQRENEAEPRVKIGPLTEAGFKHDIYEEIIEFKTGNLIIRDWFNREGSDSFSDAVIDFETMHFDSTNMKERVSIVSQYANKGLVSVNVGNTNPSVYLVKGNLYIGEGPEIKKGLVFKGNIDTDMFAGSVIDESTFVDLLIQSGMKKQKALKELDLIKKEDNTILVKVKPGKYKLSFCGEHKDFNKKYRQKFKNNNLGDHKPYFALERMKS